MWIVSKVDTGTELGDVTTLGLVACYPVAGPSSASDAFMACLLNISSFQHEACGLMMCHYSRGKRQRSVQLRSQGASILTGK